MITFLKREFTVSLPLEQAWEHLARVEQWPSWAAHIKRIELRPPGELGRQSTGVIHLTNGIRPTFRMTEFNRPSNWKWASPLLWLNLLYDHQFEAVDAEHTRMTWVVQARGFAAGLLGRLFARVYARDMDRAIDRLIREMNRPTTPA